MAIFIAALLNWLPSDKLLVFAANASIFSTLSHLKFITLGCTLATDDILEKLLQLNLEVVEKEK